MKNSKLILLLISLSFSSLSFAQKTDDVKITVKDKKGKKEVEILPHFIQFGIMSKNHQDFRKKYNVDVVYENCVISPVISKLAEKNNVALAKNLTEKYGETWKKDLGIIPYGL
ncbi:hypothetical protein [Chryseobacterium sp. G0201]|uniref:FEKKY domain-containing protein n=1 Tax=Chryseobacterium sp. G0201 TaxID=2487065 RepID=UPI000F511193|nr:hypothetical protein [Chryseobacterium sp. G0201]AZA52179.1 hypothetical protein EG348_03740 [Chryseobacterium sp. G0201]